MVTSTFSLDLLSYLKIISGWRESNYKVQVARAQPKFYMVMGDLNRIDQPLNHRIY